MRKLNGKLSISRKCCGRQGYKMAQLNDYALKVMGRIHRDEDNGFQRAYLELPVDVANLVNVGGAPLDQRDSTVTVPLEQLVTGSETSGASGADVSRVANVREGQTTVSLRDLVRLLGDETQLNMVLVDDQHSKGLDSSDRHQTIVDNVYRQLHSRFSDRINVVNKEASEGEARTSTVPNNYVSLPEFLADGRVPFEAKYLVYEEINRRRLELNASINDILKYDEMDFLMQYEAEKLLPYFKDIEGVDIEDIGQNYHAYRLMKVFGFYNEQFKEDITKLLGFNDFPQYEMITADGIAPNWFVDRDEVIRKYETHTDLEVTNTMRIDLERLMPGIEQQDYTLLRMTTAGMPLLSNMRNYSPTWAVAVHMDSQNQEENIASLDINDHNEKSRYSHLVLRADFYEGLRLAGAKLDRLSKGKSDESANAVVDWVAGIARKMDSDLQYLACKPIDNLNWTIDPLQIDFEKRDEALYLSTYLKERLAERMERIFTGIAEGETYTDKAVPDTTYEGVDRILPKYQKVRSFPR